MNAMNAVSPRWRIRKLRGKWEVTLRITWPSWDATYIYAPMGTWPTWADALAWIERAADANYGVTAA